MRINDAFKEKKVPRYIFLIAATFFPLEILLTENPEESGFLFHYLPYIGFKILLLLTPFENVLYFHAMKALPFNNNPPAAIGYLFVLFTVTFLGVLLGMSVALGNPILDTVHNDNHRLFLQSLSRFYFFLAIPVPLVLSGLELKRSPKHTLSFA